MSAAREAFVQNDATTIREALDWLFRRAELREIEDFGYVCVETKGQRDDALAALDRLEELAAA